MKKQLFAVIVAVSSISTSANAEHLTLEGWSQTWSEIEFVYPNGNLAFTLKDISFQGGTCNSGRQFYLDSTQPFAQYDVQAKTLLAAYFDERKVRIWWDGTYIHGGCFARVGRFIVK